MYAREPSGISQGWILDFWKEGSYVLGEGARFADLTSFFLNMP